MTVYAGRKTIPVSAYKTAVLADNPISYWRLNDAVGASAPVDVQGQSTGAAYTAYVENGVGRLGMNPGDLTAGSIGLDISSTGRSAITLTSTAPFDVGPPFTIECMVMTQSTNGVTLVNFTNPSSPNNGYGLGISHTTAGQLDVNEGASGWYASGISVNDGNWHHIACVYTGGSSVTIYKDGASAATFALAATPTLYSGAASMLGIGGTNSGPVYMSEVAVYGTALSGSRVAAHYAAAQADLLSDRVLLLTATDVWEDGGVVEPNLYWDGSLTGGTGKWCNIFRGGQSPTTVAIGYATSSNADPTIPAGWTKYVSNPIIGGGAGGFSDHCYTPSIYIESGTLYVTFTDYSSGDIYICSGPDALHLGTPTKIFTHTTGSCGNMWIVKNGSTYVLFFDMIGSGAWGIGIATSATVDGTYTLKSYPLSLGDTNHGQGGSWAAIIDGTCILRYHSAGYYSSGLPSQAIYRTATTDLVNFATWTTPQIEWERWHYAEYDQVADPQLVIPGQPGAPSSGPLYYCWDGDDNVNPTASIFISRSGIVSLIA